MKNGPIGLFDRRRYVGYVGRQSHRALPYGWPRCDSANRELRITEPARVLHATVKYAGREQFPFRRWLLEP